MAVMQTPHGRVIGLILNKEDQPVKEVSERNGEASSPSAQSAATSPPHGGAASRATTKKSGRTGKK